jgi:hypothetical protein
VSPLRRTMSYHFPIGPSPSARSVPATRHPSPVTHEEEPFYPEEHAPARPANRPDRGDAWEPPTGEPDEDAPTDGRQLLGWASKQIPDLKGALIGWGKKKGLASKIVQWSPAEVAAAYRFARARQAQPRR